MIQSYAIGGVAGLDKAFSVSEGKMVEHVAVMNGREGIRKA